MFRLLLPWALLQLILVTAGCEERSPTPAGLPRTPHEAVRRTLADYQAALRAGDGKAFWATFSDQSRTLGNATADFTFPARPELQVEIHDVRLRSRTAAAFATMSVGDDQQYDAYFLVKESDGWRIDYIAGGNTPVDPRLFLPPETGRFLDAGEPWGQVTPLSRIDDPAPSGLTRTTWQAVHDESFLYLRLSSEGTFPNVGEALDADVVTAADLGFLIDPVRVVAGDRDASAFTVLVGSTATAKFVPGQRNSYSLTYSLNVDGPELSFATFADSDGSAFAVVEGAMVIRIPLDALGAHADTRLSVGTPTSREPHAVATW